MLHDYIIGSWFFLKSIVINFGSQNKDLCLISFEKILLWSWWNVNSENEKWFFKEKSKEAGKTLTFFSIPKSWDASSVAILNIFTFSWIRAWRKNTINTGWGEGVYCLKVRWSWFQNEGPCGWSIFQPVCPLNHLISSKC